MDASTSAAENQAKREKKIPLEIDSVTNSTVRSNNVTPDAANGVPKQKEEHKGTDIPPVLRAVWLALRIIV